MKGIHNLLIGLACFAVALAWIFHGATTHRWKNPGDTVWWVTDSCPVGVAAPCLDNRVSLSRVPAWAK